MKHGLGGGYRPSSSGAVGGLGSVRRRGVEIDRGGEGVDALCAGAGPAEGGLLRGVENQGATGEVDLERCTAQRLVGRQGVDERWRGGDRIAVMADLVDDACAILQYLNLVQRPGYGKRRRSAVVGAQHAFAGQVQINRAQTGHILVVEGECRRQTERSECSENSAEEQGRGSHRIYSCCVDTSVEMTLANY